MTTILIVALLILWGLSKLFAEVNQRTVQIIMGVLALLIALLMILGR